MNKDPFLDSWFKLQIDGVPDKRHAGRGGARLKNSLAPLTVRPSMPTKKRKPSSYCPGLEFGRKRHAKDEK